MNSYELSRSWFDWAFENPELINPNHSAIYFFAIEHCNRLGWRDKFGFPTQMAMDAVGIKKYDTYIKYFNQLVDWGFFKLVQKSVNQYSSNIISLQSAHPKNGKALSKAILKHTGKQPESNGESKHESNGSINKPITNEPINHIYRSFKHLSISVEDFNRLNETHSKTLIDSVLDSIENYKKNTNYVNLYLTAKKWLAKEQKEIQSSEYMKFKAPVTNG